MKKSLLTNWVYYLPAGHLVDWNECKQPDCMKDAEIERRIPDILAGARLLQDPAFTFERAGRSHIEKFKAAGYDGCGLG